VNKTTVFSLMMFSHSTIYLPFPRERKWAGSGRPERRLRRKLGRSLVYEVRKWLVQVVGLALFVAVMIAYVRGAFEMAGLLLIPLQLVTAIADYPASIPADGPPKRRLRRKLGRLFVRQWGEPSLSPLLIIHRLQSPAALCYAMLCNTLCKNRYR